MELYIEGEKINTRELEKLLNNVLSKYNIQVDLTEYKWRGKQVVNIKIKLINPVHFASTFSLIYNERQDKLLRGTGMYINAPREEFGTKKPFPHFYHIALLNDIIAYIMESLKDNGYISNWVFQSSIMTVKSRDWRRYFQYKYYPQYDPAFKKPLTYSKTIKGVRITSRLDQALNTIQRLPKYIETGKLSPRDIPKFVETLAVFTGIQYFYRPRPNELKEVSPLIRAYLITNMGREEAENFIKELNGKDISDYEDRVKSFLEKVSTVKDTKFQKFLNTLVDEITEDLGKAMAIKGSVADHRVMDTDDAGFPYGLAVKLRKTPYIPEEVKNFDIKKLITREGRREKVAV